MTRAARALCASALLAALVAAAGACRGEPDPDVAELTSILTGRAERSAQGQPWHAARAGNRFRVGDGVRTSSDGGARLRFLAGGGLRMGPSTTIRFGRGALAVDGELEAEGDDAVVELEVGRALIAAGSRVRIGRHGGDLRFDVLVGSAVVTRGDKRLEVTAGHALAVDRAGRRFQLADPASPVTRAAAIARPTQPGTGTGSDPGLGASGATEAGTGAAPPDAGSGTGSPAPDLGTGPPADPGAATVVADVKGSPARTRASDADDWAPLAMGQHPVAAGAQLSVPRRGTVELVREGERAVVHGPAEVVVAPGGPTGALVEARRGRAEMRARAADVAVRVPGGLIVARRGARAGSGAELTVERSETRVVATGGVVDVVGDQGGRERLLAGQSSVVEGGGSLRVFGRPPERADFSAVAGLSATIHDPSPPTDVRLRFGELCPEAGVVELAQGESFRAARVMVEGRGAAIVRLARGAHRYRVRCFDGNELADRVAASGRLTVVRDGGTRPLARGVPHNPVDADGRRYTVLYQNRLPAITFSWPDAPEADRYRLLIAPRRGRTVEYALPSPGYAMKPGDLPEGEYRYWFEAVGAGRQSRESTLTIDFDNAARSGYLQSPRPGADWSDSVTVSGAAIEGWRVSVAGDPLPLDRQHRFSATVSRAPDEDGIAVEFRHPGHGVHLYVRRPRSP